ncbi:MAG: TrmB family transcriptional regulator [Candidatus Moraniibacteriota bacterium]|jgi:HTH-type transcriptional regulator, sugar sensing transcriptional regulator
MLIQELEKLNLSEKEARLYLSLLELGEVNLQRISEKSKIKRTTVYDILDSLKEKGLVSLTKKGKRIYYYAENPKVIETIFKEKINILEGILPELLSVANLIDRKPKIQFFEGIEGIKNIYRDTLEYKNQEILAWASPEAIEYFDIEYLWKEYVPQRLKNKIWTRSFAPNTDGMQHVKEYDEKHLRQMKLIDFEDNLFFEVEINLYAGHKIGIMSFKEEFGLIIESKKIYNTLKAIFELQWKSVK